MALSGFDLIIVFSWLTLTLGAGMYAGLRADLSAFWISGRSAATLPLVMSVVSTQIGAGALVGIASATFHAGTGFGLVSAFSTVAGFLLVALLAPAIKRFGDRFDAFTLAQSLRIRYGRSTQVAAALVLLFTYISILAAQFLATSTLLALGTGLNLQAAVIFAVLGVVAYSAFAGLRGDIVTDIWHMVGMTLAMFAVLLPAIVIQYWTPGWTAAIPTEIWNPVTFGGYSFLVAGFVFGAAIPLVMPELWMKVYASRTANEGRRVMLYSAIAVIPFYAFAMFLGLIGHVGWKQLAVPDQLIFQQMSTTLPPVLLGFVIASFLSVILSSANSLIVVIGSTIFGDVLDYRLKDNRYITASRIVTGASGIIGAIFALAAPNLVQLLLAAFFMLLVIIPSLVCVLWQRATQTAATWSITLGALATIAALFVTPSEAFIPGIAVSIGAFLILSFLSSHSSEEQISEIRTVVVEKRP